MKAASLMRCSIAVAGLFIALSGRSALADIARSGFSDLTAPLEIVVERDPSRIAAAKRLARLHAEARNWEAAWRVLERSQPYALKDAEYQGFVGTVLRQQKRPGEAAAAYRRAIALQPQEGRWWVGLGLSLEDAGLRQEAKQAYAAAREREQTLSPALLKITERRGR
ncbi:MAG TPA: tetratricopeptide repeat protein [Azospira sp.]|nr:tetratricopeptide repeat protein [Accumulibacter sp.]HNJ75137.1 tetratricopeptide repeat protein [Azospira sp.]HNN44500.1 tetratricopeptide repeat protein [Azospira sp.]